MFKNNDYYDTLSKWTFALGFVPALNKNQAITIANMIQQNLKTPRGPVFIDPGWACYYDYDDSLTSGIAMTPPTTQAELAKMAERLVHTR